jgi:hypothetical protein
MNQGLSNLTVFAVALAPTSPPDLYAGTAGGSVFAFGRPQATTARLPVEKPLDRGARPRTAPPRP